MHGIAKNAQASILPSLFRSAPLPVLLGFVLLSPVLQAAQQDAQAAAASAAVRHQAKEAALSATTSHHDDARAAAKDGAVAGQAQAQAQATASPELKCRPDTACPETACPDCPAVHSLSAAQLAAVQLLSGVVVSAIALPASLALAGAIGTGPSDLYAAGLPALLLFAVLPPVATASAQWAMGDWLAPGRSGSLGWALGAAALTHVAAIATAVALRVSTHDLAATTSYVAAESLLLPVVVSATLALSASGEAEESAQ